MASITLLWSAVALLAGVIVGAFWGDLRRTQRSEELTRACDRIRALDAKADHFAFGITDLEVRIRAADNEIAMLRADLKVRRATYERLNTELRGRWDEAIECKRELAAQEQNADDLRAEIANWKDKLDTLHKRMESGNVTDRTLKRELAAGLSAIFTEAGDELPAIQRMLLENTIDIGLSGDLAHKGYREIFELLSARIDLLENQVRYWQDRSTGTISEQQPPPQDPSELVEQQTELPFAELTEITLIVPDSLPTWKTNLSPEQGAESSDKQTATAKPRKASPNKTNKRSSRSKAKRTVAAKRSSGGNSKVG